jgi:hypothetical protein
LTDGFGHPSMRVEIDHVEEGRFEEGEWRAGRTLNEAFRCAQQSGG